jgi:nucleoid-associated protein YgaU
MSGTDKEVRMDKEVHRDKEPHADKEVHKAKKPARIGKEAKIGLTVIVALLIALGAVLVRRFTGSREESPLAVAEEKKGPGGEKAKEVAAMMPRKEGEPAWVPPHKPTVVAAQGASTHAPGRSPSDLDAWAVASDDSRAKQAGSGSAPAGQSFLPEERHKHPGHATDRYPDEDATAAKVKTLEIRSEEIARAEVRKEEKEARQEHDPFRNRIGSADSSLQERQAAEQALANAARGAETPGAKSHPASDNRYAFNDPAAEASRSSHPETPSRFAPGSRYSDPTMPPAPEPGAAYAGGDNRYAGNSQYTNVQPSPQYGKAYSATPHHAGGKGLGFAGGGAASLGKNGRRDDGTYEIQPNDTYWIISEKLYGTGAYFKALAEQNRKKVPQEDRLQVGDVIVTPDVTQLEKSYPDLCPKASHREAAKQRATTVSTTLPYGAGRAYVTEKGDTLFDIARIELGKASRWVEIYELNRDQLGSDYNYLPPGLQLVMPEKESSDNTTRRQSNATLRR